MEALKNINIEAVEPTQKSLQNHKTSTTTISLEQHAALFALINKVRMLQGWTTKTAQELDATIRTWGEILGRYNIPLEHYQTLYWRAFDARQSRLTLGGTVPDFDATLLVSQWTGPNGLERELNQKRDRKQLPPEGVMNPAEGMEYFKSLTKKGPRLVK